MEEFVETFNQTIDLFEKTLSVYQAGSVPEAQRHMQDLIESSLTALRTNVHSALNTDAKIYSWIVSARQRSEFLTQSISSRLSFLRRGECQTQKAVKSLARIVPKRIGNRYCFIGSFDSETLGQCGPQRVLGRFGRLSVELRWEDSSAKSQAVQSSRRRSQIVRSNLEKSLPDNDYPTLAPLYVGIWISPCFLACFGATIHKRKPGQLQDARAVNGKKLQGHARI
jgi:hypothetical protein